MLKVMFLFVIGKLCAPLNLDGNVEKKAETDRLTLLYLETPMGKKI